MVRVEYGRQMVDLVLRRVNAVKNDAIPKIKKVVRQNLHLACMAYEEAAKEIDVDLKPALDETANISLQEWEHGSLRIIELTPLEDTYPSVVYMALRMDKLGATGVLAVTDNTGRYSVMVMQDDESIAYAHNIPLILW